MSGTGFEWRACAVAAELVFDPKQRVVRVDVADGDAERFADA